MAWFSAIDPAASIMLVSILFALWRWQRARGRDRGEISLIADGAWITAAANALLAVAAAGSGRVSAFFPIAYDILLGVGFLYGWPTLLALVSRTAPRRVNATMMGTAFLSLFVANILIRRIGGLYEQMSATAFWWLNSGIAASGGVLAMALRPRLLRWLQPAETPPGRLGQPVLEPMFEPDP